MFPETELVEGNVDGLSSDDYVCHVFRLQPAFSRLKKQVHFSWSTSAKLEHECKLQITRTAKVSPLLTLSAAFYGLVQLCCL